MMGTHNPDFQRGLDSVFNCIHFDWTPYYKPNERHHVAQYTNALQVEILKRFNDFKPEIVFLHLQCGDAVLVDTVNRMRREGALVFSWTGDVRYPLPNFYLDFGRHINSTLFTNMNDVMTCNNNGVKADFLQVGFDSKYFNPLGKTSLNYPEIIFMGSNYPSANFPLSKLRLEMVQRIRNEFGNKFMVYGGGWDKVGVPHNVINGYEEEGTAYRSCKIAINLSHFDYFKYSSDRMYRILGSGAFCLSHKYQGIDTDFKIGHDLDVWNNLDELVSKIRYYLANDVLRERISMNGCYNAHTNFTWHHFAQNLEKISLIIKK